MDLERRVNVIGLLAGHEPVKLMYILKLLSKFIGFGVVGAFGVVSTSSEIKLQTTSAHVQKVGISNGLTSVLMLVFVVFVVVVVVVFVVVVSPVVVPVPVSAWTGLASVLSVVVSLGVVVVVVPVPTIAVFERS